MKYMNMNRYWSLNLQLFADGEGGDPGAGENDDDDSGADPDDDLDGDGDNDPDGDDEKLFSQEELNDAIKKRLAREKRKWQREQQKKAGQNKPDGKGKPGADDKGDDEETQALRRKAEKADDLELKWTCLEHDVDKSCVDDVLALAKVHMAKDEELDIEDAIDQVLKKYPQFKEASLQEGDDTNGGKGKAWAQRLKGRKTSVSGVEAAFLKKNPGLKID